MSAVTDTLNIARHLPDMARRQPEALAVAVQGHRARDGSHAYETCTAAELEAESNRLARGLQRAGIGAGTRTVLMVTPSLPFFALTFALFKAGAIPVLVDPGMGVRNLKACLAEAEPEAFIGIPKAHVARLVLGWARRSLRRNIVVGSWFPGAGMPLDCVRDGDASALLSQVDADDTAAILFTSGSTGVPKGVVYTHAHFDAQIRCLRDDYGIEPGERDLATFPLFALFGPALGMASIVPDMDASKPIAANPEHLVAAVRDFEATNLFASPALIEVLGRHTTEHGIKLPSILRVISAGAPSEPASLARFARSLTNGVPIFPSYGATEALPITTIAHRELIDETATLTSQGFGVCVGRPVSQVALRIIRISDDAILEWTPDLGLSADEIGEICVKGPQVTHYYFRNVEGTSLAKIADPADGEFWHRMGDVGYLDAQGRLWFCGRKSHRVRIVDSDLFTIPIERIFNAHDAVRRTALVGVGTPGEQEPVLCVELETGTPASRWPSIREDLLRMGERYTAASQVRTLLLHSGFPVDVRHNAKIFREQLAVWAGRKVR